MEDGAPSPASSARKMLGAGRARLGITTATTVVQASPVFLAGATSNTMEVRRRGQGRGIYTRCARRAIARSSGAFLHAYLDGFAVYFTFAGINLPDDVETTSARGNGCSATVVGTAAGVAPHGIGQPKRRSASAPRAAVERVSRLKARVDPHGVFKRGKWPA